MGLCCHSSPLAGRVEASALDGPTAAGTQTLQHHGVDGYLLPTLLLLLFVPASMPALLHARTSAQPSGLFQEGCDQLKAWQRSAVLLAWPQPAGHQPLHHLLSRTLGSSRLSAYVENNRLLPWLRVCTPRRHPLWCPYLPVPISNSCPWGSMPGFPLQPLAPGTAVTLGVTLLLLCIEPPGSPGEGG